MTRISLLLLSALVLFPSMAKADYFLWQEPKSGLTVTFPDTWEKQNNKNTLDVLTIEAPSKNNNPVCTIKVDNDKRFTIFPPEYGQSVQKVAVSVPFWESYMGLYDEYDIARVYDGGALGRWVASYATASYTLRNGTAYQQRRGIMFASLYYDKLYIVECSALAHGYERWEKDFRSVIKSIDFKQIYHHYKNGHYDNFLRDADLYFWSQTGPEGTIGYN